MLSENPEPVKEEEAPPVIITHFDNRFPVLEQKSLPIEFPISDEDRDLINRMQIALYQMESNAVGIAAIQMGFAKNAFVMRRNDGTIIECINPTVLTAAKEFARRAEGCLSLPNHVVYLKRPKELALSYYDVDGNHFTETFRGIEARIVCHEMDHLNGTMISHHLEQQEDRALRLKRERKRILRARKEKRRRLAKLRR